MSKFSNERFQIYLKLSKKLYKSIGFEPFERSREKSTKMLLNMLLIFNLINLNITFVAEIIYVFMLLQTGDLVMAVTTCSYIAFVAISESKTFLLFWKNKQMTGFLEELYKLFPKNQRQECQYKLARYTRQFKAITKGYLALYIVLIWTYNLKALVDYIIINKWLHNTKHEQELPYSMYTPWRWQGHWSYYVICLSHSIAGYFCAVGQVSNDLLFCSSTMQVIMQYDYISRSLLNYQPVENHDENLRFLSKLIALHDKVLSLSQTINELFGISLLFNFLTSSFNLCFLGFQMTMGVTVDMLVKLGLYFVSAVAQAYLISYFGQELIDASENVAVATYNHNWFNTDLRYKKMLIIMAHRAQKPAILKATYFLHISRETMTDLLQTSYKFFALLRTLYENDE